MVVSVIDQVATRRRRAGLDADFLALVCADEELLRAEFDAIIAAGWGCPQGRRPHPPVSTHPLPKRSEAPSTRPAGIAARRHSPTVPARARQRSPPRHQLRPANSGNGQPEGR